MRKLREKCNRRQYKKILATLDLVPRYTLFYRHDTYHYQEVCLINKDHDKKVFTTIEKFISKPYCAVAYVLFINENPGLIKRAARENYRRMYPDEWKLEQWELDEKRKIKMRGKPTSAIS